MYLGIYQVYGVWFLRDDPLSISWNTCFSTIERPFGIVSLLVVGSEMFPLWSDPTISRDLYARFQGSKVPTTDDMRIRSHHPMTGIES